MLTVKRLILFGVGFMFFISWSKEERVYVSVLPMVKDAELHFRGFVTDEQEELVSKIRLPRDERFVIELLRVMRAGNTSPAHGDNAVVYAIQAN